MNFRRTTAFMILAAGTVASVGAAHAKEGLLVGEGGADTVFVWKDQAAQKDAMALIDAKVHQTKPELLMDLMACMVPSGTRAIVTDGGFRTMDVMVIEGEHAGCRGNIPAGDFDTK